MTNEQEKARELAKLLTAFADGKQLQLQVKNLERWSDLQVSNIEELIKNFNVPLYAIRIKPETKRIALNQQDLIERRKLGFKAMWVRNSKGDEYFISGLTSEGVCIDKAYFTYEDLAEDLTFLDNSPCYKEVECE